LCFAQKNAYLCRTLQTCLSVLKIDIHSHIIPDHLPRFAEKFGYSGFIHLEHHRPGFARMMLGNTFFREIAENCWNPEIRLNDMERNKIDVQVICTIPVMFSYWAKGQDALQLSQFLNDHIAKVVQTYPKQFVGLGTVPLQDPQLAIAEAERCINELGFAGIQIGTHVNDWNLNDPELFPFFESCEKMGACLLVHPWDMIGKEVMQRYWLPWLVGMPAETSRAICSMIFGGIFERLPNLRVAFCHGGGAFPGSIGRIEHGFKCRPDLVAIDNPTNPRSYLGKFWIDSVVFDPAFFKYLLEIIGPDKIALGSDYPFPLGELETGHLIDSLNLPNDIKNKLYNGSALKWLNLPADKFW
jgi:aminocarboxymuconate-semialdehyde decarboxylase